MSLIFQSEELKKLMENFYTLTGIRIVLFDKEFNEIASYPENEKSFCSIMRRDTAFDKKCRMCDRLFLSKCGKTEPLCVYTCHAGLIEATTAIIENGNIIGYLMLGQITDEKDKKVFIAKMKKLCKSFSVSDEEITFYLKKIKYKSRQQIYAASNIMEACAGYIYMKELVRSAEKELIKPIETYIEEHLCEEITVDRLCREFFVSRTQLYKIMNKYYEGGIASFIKQKRLETAKRLIKTTDKQTKEIAYEVGFKDYNYFLRVFKARYGVSPSNIRSGNNA